MLHLARESLQPDTALGLGSITGLAACLQDTGALLDLCSASTIAVRPGSSARQQQDSHPAGSIHGSAPHAGRQQPHLRLVLPLASGTLVPMPTPGHTLPPQALPQPAVRLPDSKVP